MPEWLIVEDDYGVRTTLVNMLELEGYAVEAARDRLFAGETGEVHGKKSRVGKEERQPEVPFAEALGEYAPMRKKREPVVRGAEQAEDSGHRHDEVEVADDEECVVQILVENRLRDNDAAEAARDEQ